MFWLRFTGDVPDHLKDSHYYGVSKLGRGVGYKYPHDYPDHHVEQQYLPDNIKDRQYFESNPISKYERFLKERCRELE